MKLRVVNSFVCLCVLSGICFALLCEIPLTQGGVEAARNIWVVVLYRRLEPAGCELALFSFYLDFTHPIQWCKGSGVRVRVDGAGKTSFSLGFERFSSMDSGYQEHDRYDL